MRLLRARTRIRHSPLRRREYRLRLDGLEDRSLPSFVAGASFPVGVNDGLGSRPVSIATGDFNGDGTPDVATAIQNGRCVSVLLANGNGGFLPADNIDIGRNPDAIVPADFNGDGQLDLATANQADSSVTVLLGTGDGAFVVYDTITAGASGAAAVAAADFNGDGKIDLATANRSAGTSTVFFGDGSGQFSPGGQFAVASSPSAIAAADFNGDGAPDIVTVSGGFGQLSVILNNGNGSFALPVTYSIGMVGSTVAVGDFNEDNRLDVAVVCAFPSGDGVNVLLGNGDGTLRSAVNYDAGNQTPAKLVVGDLNGDGHQDLITANGQFANNSVSYLPGVGDGTFAAARVFIAGQGPADVAVGDFNGDGKQDIVSADAEGSVGTVTLLRGNGDGTVKGPLNLLVNGSRPGQGQILAVDLTADGYVDLAVVTTGVSYNGVTIFPGTGDGAFGAAMPTPTVLSPNGLAENDFNGDGKRDLAVTSGAGVSILLGIGDGTFGSPQTFGTGTGVTWVTSADFNADGKADVALANSSATGISILLGNGDGTLNPATAVNAGGAATYVATGDLNGDGKLDLAVILETDSKVSTLLGNGNGTFAAPETHATEVEPHSVTIGDLDGDGDPDLAVTTFFGPPVNSAWQIFANDGAGSFTPSTEYITDSRPIGSALIDFNGDGRPDVVTVNNFDDTICVFTGNADGTFNDPKRYVVGDRPTWIAASDFNGDGRPDLAVVNSNSNTVSVLSSLAPATHLVVEFAEDTSTAGQTVHLVVNARDANGDVVPDFLGQVTVTSDNPADVLPDPYQFNELDAGSHTFDFGLSAAGRHTITVTTSLGAYTDFVDVSPDVADRYQFLNPTTPTAGSPFDVTIKVLDQFDNLAAGYNGTVHFSTTDPNGGVSLPGDYTFTALDGGQHTFAGGVTLLTAGPRSLSATLTGLGTINNSLTVKPADASRLTISAPATSVAGTSFNVTITAFDPYDNRVTGFLGTVHLDSTDPTAVLPGDYTFTPGDLGIVGLPVTFKKAGPQTISVSSAGLPVGQTGAVQVSPANPSKYAFVQAPTDTFPNVAMGSPIKVQLQDTYGNAVAGIQSVTLSLSFNPTAAKLRNAVAVTDSTGLAVFPKLTLNKIGQGYRLIAQGASGKSDRSDPFNLYATTKFKLTVASKYATAGTAFDVTVAALDRFNLPDATYRGTVHFSTNALLANLPADYTFTAADAGQHTFSVSLNTAGTKRLVVNDMLKPKLKRTQVMSIAATDASAFLVTGVRTSARLGVTYSLVVTAVDRFGNRATNYAGTVNFSTNGTAVLPPSYTFLPKEKGRHTFKVKFTAPGTGLSLTATDQNDGTITGSETGITVV